MAGNAWADFIAARVDSLKAESEAITKFFSHNGIRGSIRELFVKQFLEPFLPPQIGIGTGEIINHEGGRSRQLDVVLYNKDRVPPVLVSGSDTGVFPWECVIAVIEVKSTVTTGVLYDAHINSNSVASVYTDLREPEVLVGGVKPKDSMFYFTPIPYYLFGFATDLAESSEAEEKTEVTVGSSTVNLGREGARLNKSFDDLEKKRSELESVITNEQSASKDIKKAKELFGRLGGAKAKLSGQKILGICVAGREWSTGNISFSDQLMTQYGNEPVRVGRWNYYWDTRFSSSAKEESLSFLHQIIELSYEMPKCRQHFNIARYLS